VVCEEERVNLCRLLEAAVVAANLDLPPWSCTESARIGASSTTLSISGAVSTPPLRRSPGQQPRRTSPPTRLWVLHFPPRRVSEVARCPERDIADGKNTLGLPYSCSNRGRPAPPHGLRCSVIFYPVSRFKVRAADSLSAEAFIHSHL
jgi:hypothetical protein